jgi:hypothetical protein
VAAQALADADPLVDYFPAYEIVTAPHTRGAYFGPDAREVTRQGVRHVMRVFLKHYGGVDPPAPGGARTSRKGARPATGRKPRKAAGPAARRDMVDVICEEELLAADKPAAERRGKRVRRPARS